MQPAVIVRMFVASPGDVSEERDAALRMAVEWNAAHSLERGAVIEPVRIETHAEAALGDHPQEIINRTLLDRCDFLLAIFWSKLGTPTPTEKSGTIHEIKEFANRKGSENVMVFFSEKDFPNSISPNALAGIQGFREEMKTQGLYISYQPGEFYTKLRQQVDRRMNRLLESTAFRNLWTPPSASASDHVSEDVCIHDYAFRLRRLGETFLEKWQVERSCSATIQQGVSVLRICAAAYWDLANEYSRGLSQSIKDEVLPLYGEMLKLPDDPTDIWDAGFAFGRRIVATAELIEATCSIREPEVPF